MSIIVTYSCRSAAILTLIAVSSCQPTSVLLSSNKIAFKAVVSPSTGSGKLCALDEPDTVIASVKSLLQCSARCAAGTTLKTVNYQTSECRYFNYRQQSYSPYTTANDSGNAMNFVMGGSCELYHSAPNCSFDGLRACTLYRVRIIKW